MDNSATNPNFFSDASATDWSDDFPSLFNLDTLSDAGVDMSTEISLESDPSSVLRRMSKSSTATTTGSSSPTSCPNDAIFENLMDGWMDLSFSESDIIPDVPMDKTQAITLAPTLTTASLDDWTTHSSPPEIVAPELGTSPESLSLDNLSAPTASYPPTLDQNSWRGVIRLQDIEQYGAEAAAYAFKPNCQVAAADDSITTHNASPAMTVLNTTEALLAGAASGQASAHTPISMDNISISQFQQPPMSHSSSSMPENGRDPVSTVLWQQQQYRLQLEQKFKANGFISRPRSQSFPNTLLVPPAPSIPSSFVQQSHFGVDKSSAEAAQSVELSNALEKAANAITMMHRQPQHQHRRRTSIHETSIQPKALDISSMHPEPSRPILMRRRHSELAPLPSASQMRPRPRRQGRASFSGSDAPQAPHPLQSTSGIIMDRTLASLPNMPISNSQDSNPSGLDSAESGNDDSGGKMFSCSLCSATFSRKHDLKRHTRIHLGIRPFGCEVCNKRFTRMDALNRHWVVQRCRENGAVGDVTHAPGVSLAKVSMGLSVNAHIRPLSQDKIRTMQQLGQSVPATPPSLRVAIGV